MTSATPTRFSRPCRHDCRDALDARGAQPARDLDEWLFFGWLPLLAYLVLGSPALVERSHPHEALLIAGGASLALAIRHAWDGGAYHVFVNVVPKRAAENKD